MDSLPWLVSNRRIKHPARLVVSQVVKPIFDNSKIMLIFRK